jgi:hypothetical protein
MPEFENHLAATYNLYTRRKDDNNDGLFIRIKVGGNFVEREIVTQAP